MHSWQNGTICRYGWCHCHLVWLVFEGSIPTCACFHSENIFLVPAVFLLLVLGVIKEMRGRPKGRCMLCKVELCCPQRPRSSQIQMLSSEICKTNHLTSSMEVETAALANYMCSVVWSSYIHIFIYNSPSNTIIPYNTFSGSMHIPSTFCVV